MRNRPEVTAPAEPESTQRAGAVVFGSDQGMCGQLNELILAHALETLEDEVAAEENPTLIAVGLRIAERLKDAGHTVESYIPVPASADGIIPKAHEIIVDLERWHSQKGIRQVLLFYNRHLGGAAYQQHTTRLLPVDERWLRNFQVKRWPTRVRPTFTMDWRRLFQLFIRQHLFVSLYRAFAESLASEHASRLVSMQAAEKNIQERLEELNAFYHRQRQMTITEELLDIVSGFTALTGHGKR
jgi:F-type H+-transporting ATPase subunit gamma